MIDILIIGGGIIGCATAHFLSKYDLNICVLEQEEDVSIGASKANSGIVHSGFDCVPGTLKASLNVQGASMYKELVKTLDIPYRNNGSMVLNFDDNNKLEELYKQGIQNGVTGLEILDYNTVISLEPNINRNVKFALRSSTAGIISSYEAVIAFAEHASINGVRFYFDTEVINIKDGYIVETTKGNFSAKIIINAAGVESARLNNMINEKQEHILPQKGQYYILDNTQKHLVNHTIFQLPTPLGKGILVAPTVHYNIMLGPTAESIENGSDTSTTKQGLDTILEKVALSLDFVPIKERISTFAGVRAKHESKDFVIEETRQGFINAIGIDSPGLSAAPAIGKKIAELAIARLEPSLNKNYINNRIGIKHFKGLSKKAQAELINENPAYGNIVCRCETITEAEILDAIKRPLGSKSLDTIKRRTRAGMGRCQAGFCMIRQGEILAKELGLLEKNITKNGQGSEVGIL